MPFIIYNINTFSSSSSSSSFNYKFSSGPSFICGNGASDESSGQQQGAAALYVSDMNGRKHVRTFYTHRKRNSYIYIQILPWIKYIYVKNLLLLFSLFLIYCDLLEKKRIFLFFFATCRRRRRRRISYA